MNSTLRAGLLGGCSAIALFGSFATAQAGGFAVREQSTEFQGMSFAGNAAAGGGISGMFWNPAVSAYAPAGLTVEAHGALILPHSSMTGVAIGTTLPANSGEVGKEALVPSTYTTYRLTRDLVLGFNAGAPFGFRNGGEATTWAGQTFARNSEIKTMNYQGSVAYQVAPWLAIGAGVQIQSMRALLTSATGVAGNPSPNAEIRGSDTSLGWSAGFNVTPMKGTDIGVGYRSAISYRLQGGFGAGGNVVPVYADTTTPETVTASLRQALTKDLTLLGTIEWTNWGQLQRLDVVCDGVFAALGCASGGAVRSTLPLNWHDGWFYSAGLEWKAMQNLTLRTGAAYEKSPIQNATERTLRVPDADRIWASVGATYQITKAISADLAYTHIWVDDAPIDRQEPGTALRFVGSAHTNLDIISASFKWKLGEAK